MKQPTMRKESVSAAMKEARRPPSRGGKPTRAKDPGKEKGVAKAVAKAQGTRSKPSPLAPMGEAKKRVR